MRLRHLTGLVLLATSALAQTTTFRFSGTVASVGADLGTTVQVGNAYQADFTFDPAVALFNNMGAMALYRSTLSEIRITTSGGVLTWSASDPLSNDLNNGFTVNNNNGGSDSIIFSTGTGQLVGPSLNGNAVVSHNFTLQDSTQAVFSSVAIPNTLNPASFPTKVLRLYFDGNLPADTINFSLTSIEKNPSAIPEPSTYALAFGLAGLGGALWRRRRRAA
jgi:hypothetical protein